MNSPVHLWASAVLVGALLAGPGTACAQTFSKRQLQDTYTAHLAAQNFQPKVTEAGNVQFVRDDKMYVIYVDEADPLYFRLVLAYEEDDKSAQARLRRVEAANHTSAAAKVVKAYVDGDADPNFAVEMFLAVPGDFRGVLARALRALDAAFEMYVKRVDAPG